MDRNTNYWESNNCTARTQWPSAEESSKGAEVRSGWPCDQRTKLANLLGGKKGPHCQGSSWSLQYLHLNGKFMNWLIPNTAHAINWKRITLSASKWRFYDHLGKELPITAEDWFDNPKSPFQSYNHPIPENLVINKALSEANVQNHTIWHRMNRNPHNHHYMFL